MSRDFSDTSGEEGYSSMSRAKRHERLKDYSVFQREQGCVAGELDCCLGVGGRWQEMKLENHFGPYCIGLGKHPTYSVSPRVES